jgi:hypothetical protein
VKTVDQARADLDYIRHTLEEAGTFTAISGIGVALAGGVGILAAITSIALLPLRQPAWDAHVFRSFLILWVSAAALAVALFAISLYRKAQRWNMPLTRGPSRRALRCMAPGWIAAAVLTLALVLRAAWAFVPAAWLLLDGLALLGAATFSIPPVRWMGWTLLALGLSAAFFSSPLTSVLLLGAGFGLLHVIAGTYIERSDRG